MGAEKKEEAHPGDDVWRPEGEGVALRQSLAERDRTLDFQDHKLGHQLHQLKPKLGATS